MSGLKDDASTDIDGLVTRFAIDMSKSATELMKKSASKPKNPSADPPGGNQPMVIEFSLSPNKASKSRTPAEQAAEVAGGRSWVCWSAHMADKARHVIMSVNGKVTWDSKKVFGLNFAEFKKQWAANMRKHGLKNYKGQDGWGDGDEFHLELPDAKVERTDERAKACLREYVRLTREAGKQKNAKFEESYKALLQPYIDDAEAKTKSTSG